MITYVVGDLMQSPAKVLVNTVNTVGVMGKGIAKDFKKVYPEMFKKYQDLCEKKMFNVGQLWLYKTPHKWILNFPTKKHWRQPSKTEYIEAGLEKFVKTYAEKRITSIAFPMLGCGNGELAWEIQVKPLMEKYLKNLPIEIFIYLYRKDPFVPEHRNFKAIKKWLRNEPRSLAFTEVWDDIQYLLERKSDFNTLDNKEIFKSKIISTPEKGVIIQKKDEQVFLPEEDLLSMWQNIRDFGFCMPRTAPAELEHNLRYIVSIFSNLDYFKPVLLYNEYGKVDTRSIGLQFTAPTKKSDGNNLFAPPVTVSEV